MSRLVIPDYTLSHTLSAKSRERSSGIVTASRGRLRRLFCLEDGWLSFAASNLVEEQLEDYLERHGRIEPSQRQAAGAEAGRQGRKVLSVLLERGNVDAEAAREGMRELARTLVSSCLEWPDADVSFTPGRPKLDTEVTVRLSIVHLLLHHARRYPRSPDAVRVRIGPPDSRPRRAEAAESFLDNARVTPVMEYLLRVCDGSRPVIEVLADSPVDEETTLRALYALLLLGAVESTDARADPEPSATDRLPSREACLAVLRRAEGLDHYGILGADRSAGVDAVRDAYHGLARRFHPDRFRSGPLQDLLEPMEVYFAKVTEAYNTLSDPERRKDYDQRLEEDKGRPERESSRDRAHLARQNFLRGRELVRRGRWAEAVSFFENAIQIDDAQVDYHLDLGRLLLRNPRRRADAERHLLRAAELAPADPGVYVALGRLYRKADRPEDAARMFREALRWQPDSTEAGEELADMGLDVKPGR